MSFSEALETALSRNHEGIGTYNEKTLHHTLKLYYGGLYSTEASIGKFVADAVCADGIFEIQSKAFYRMKAKIEAFLSVSPVTVVYPITVSKNIIWTNAETGEVFSTTRSPKKGSVYCILPELYGLKNFLKNESLSFICVLVNCDEYRYADGYGKDRKKKATKVDIVPSCLIDEVKICSASDYKIFLPDSLPEVFTSSDYAKATKLRPNDSVKALLVLTEMGVVSRVGTKGKSILYTV